MSKLVFSLFVVLSLFAFVSVKAQDEKYTIPEIPVPYTNLNIYLRTSGTDCDVSNFSVPSYDIKCFHYSAYFTKIANNIQFQVWTDDLDDIFETTQIPLGEHFYRDDVKKDFFYSIFGTGSSGQIYRCEDKGTTTVDNMMKMATPYIDIASSVRNVKDKFTSKEAYVDPSLEYEYFVYSYEEEVPITDDPEFDKVKITHEYTIMNVTELCLESTHTYQRHIKDGDYELGDYAKTSQYFSPENVDILENDDDIMRGNMEKSFNYKFDSNIIDELMYTNVKYHAEDIAFVCPENDFLPRPYLLSLLSVKNYTEYQFILDNPVSIELLTEDTANILNLTAADLEHRVGYDGVFKVGEQWGVNYLLPTDLGEALATAVENGDVRKSELPTVSKVKKMIKLTGK